MDLAQAKHAFITGGANGIGLGIADALAGRGIGVTIADIDPDALAAAVSSRGGKLRGQQLDTRDRQGWAQAKAEAEAALGPVDILVNNAGIAPDGRMLADMDPAAFDRMIAINLTGVFNGVSAFAADMRERGRGHIVNTASTAGLAMPYPTIGGYAASKFAVVGMTEILRLEMARHGVGVSVLCPGLVATNLAQSTSRIDGVDRPGKLGEGMEASLMTPDQIAAIVLRGIEQDKLYIVTHGDSWPPVEQRNNAVRDAYRELVPGL